MADTNVAASVQALESRASAAEKAIDDLKTKLAGAGSNDVNLAPRLRELLTLMLEDRDECEGIRAQRDELKEENERLRAQVAKHEYRIKHLLRTINELENGKSS